MKNYTSDDKFINVLLLIIITILTLTSLMSCSNVSAQKPYTNPAHNYHMDYVVINKKIDSFMPIVIGLTGFVINHIGGLSLTKNQHDIIGGTTWFLCSSYALMIELPIRRPTKKHK